MNSNVIASLSGGPSSDEYTVLSVDIIYEVGRIPNAEIILAERHQSENLTGFTTTNLKEFEVGKELELKLHHTHPERKPDKATTVFKGIILRHTIEYQTQRPTLTLVLRDKTFKLTSVRKSNVFKEKTDTDIIKTIVSNAGLKLGSRTASTQAKHSELLQFYCSDWDFILSRAEANGCLLFVDADSQVKLIEPDLNKGEDHTLDYGAHKIKERSILDFELALDASYQAGKVESNSWDLQQQKAAPETAKAFKLEQTQLTNAVEKAATDLGMEKEQLVYGAPMAKNESRSWASGRLMRERLGLVRGRFRLLGNVDFEMGQLVKLKGLGERLNGNVLITAVRQRADNQGWVTDIQFGLSSQSYNHRKRHFTGEPSSGLLPGVNGLQIGVVEAFEKDPEGQYRVRVKVPAIPEKNAQGGKNLNVIWARLASIGSGEKCGFFFRPQPEDEVVLGFFNDDPRQAVILGSLHNKDKKMYSDDITIDDKNNERGIITPIGNKVLVHDEKDKNKITLQSLGENQIVINDECKNITLLTKNKNKIVIDDQNKEILVKDENDNSITLNSSGIEVKGKTLTFQSKGNIKIKSEGNIDISATKTTINGYVEVK